MDTDAYEQRRAWRRRQWERRNRSAHWLLQEAVEAAGTTGTPVRPDRIARCGTPLGRPVIQLIDGRASITGLEHCASPWACPICAPVIRARRAQDLQQAADHWADAGHGLLFATLTRPHTRTEPLDENMDTVTRAWARLTASQRWRAIRRAHRIRHWARTLETTWTPTAGWHTHIHLLLYTDTPHPDPDRLHTDLHHLWDTLATTNGTRHVSKRHGVLILPVTHTPHAIGAYMSKPPDHIGDELTRMDAKQGRRDSLAPFQLLDTDTLPDPGQARRLWLAYVHATRGQHSITWSRRLRGDLLDHPDQPTDRQIIDTTRTGTPVLPLTPATYRKLKQTPDLLSHILTLTETGETPLAQQLTNTI